VNEESLVAAGHKVTGLLVGAVADLHAAALAKLLIQCSSIEGGFSNDSNSKYFWQIHVISECRTLGMAA